jgi:hypothetical protein
VNALDFEWPKALRALVAAAESGTLEPRELYPREVAALCNLIAGVPLDESARVVAPEMTVTTREDFRSESNFAGKEVRRAFFFVRRLENGQAWLCSLFTAWIWEANPRRQRLSALEPRNIAKALTRIAPYRGQS